MIQLPRSLARTVRAVFRRLVKKSVGPERPVVSCRADRTGLRVRLHHAEVRAEFQQAGSYAPETITLPFEALADWEGRGNDNVILEDAGPGRVQARWEDAGVPQMRDYDVPAATDLLAFPIAPANLQPCGPDLWKALTDASASAAREGIRYALQKIQLRGRAGEVIGTDGHQMLLQGGFRFPFTDDVLIPSSTLFGSKELAGTQNLALGTDKQFVTLQSGAWTFYFPIDKEGRYPKVEQVIPSMAGGATRCSLSAEDSGFLAKSLPRLPGGEDEHAPVTLDLNGRVIVRARAAEQPRPTEVVLSGSQATGKPVRISINRDLLARALDLGFRELAVVNADAPLLCQDDRRRFVFMPLSKDGLVGPSEDALRITSSGAQEPGKAPRTERKRSASVALPPAVEDTTHEETLLPEEGIPTVRERIGATNGNGKETHSAVAPAAARGKINGSVVHDLLEEAATLKDVLRDAFTRVHRLMAGLQRHRKQSRAVQSTLASLRQLQHFDDE